MIPPARVLAAVDFSEPSRTALVFAARLARQSGAELHVVHALDPLLAAAAQQRQFDVVAETREELRSFTCSTYPASDCSPRYHVLTGNAPEAILAVAARETADLVVVGAHGMSGATRLVFGSTTEGLLRRADLSVLVVPDGWTPPVPESAGLSGTGPIVAGIDLATPSIEAGAAAARLAGLLQTEAVLVHIVPRVRVLERWRAHADAAAASSVERARRELELVRKGIATPVPVRLLLDVGDIAERLAEAAEAHPRGMLVLGRAPRPHGYGPPGAIAYRVLMKARVPVLMYTVK